MDHKLIPLVLIMIGTLVSVVFATSAVQPNPVAAEYPLPPRPPVVPPDPTPRSRSGGSSGGSPPDLELVQQLSATTLQQGDLVEITLITRHIAGSRPAEDVLIFLELPTFFSIMSAQTSGWGTFAIQGEQVSVQIPALYKGNEVVTTIVGMVEEPPIYDQMQLIGSVSSSTPESNLDNNMMGQMVFFP